MSAITNVSINLDKIPEDAIVKGEKGRYVNLTVFQNDETRYQNNASVALSQTKEDRESGNQKVYLGNGRVVFVSDSGVSLPEAEDAGTPDWIDS